MADGLVLDSGAGAKSFIDCSKHRDADEDKEEEQFYLFLAVQKSSIGELVTLLLLTYNEQPKRPVTILIMLTTIFYDFYNFTIFHNFDTF